MGTPRRAGPPYGLPAQAAAQGVKIGREKGVGIGSDLTEWYPSLANDNAEESVQAKAA
jgi:hypothetical protein